jgi:hypothetical protein
MCTVTFIPGKEKIFLTSNRDEKYWRHPAIIPAVYTLKTGRVLFPKDGNAGGSWFAVHENGNAVVFLNGAGKKHIPQPPYRQSRGLILLELVDSEMPVHHFSKTSLHDIEPFTAIIWNEESLFACRWDGTRKYRSRLDNKMPQIWSSVTLYDEAVIAKRKAWFTAWLNDNPAPGQEEILRFHRFTGDGDRSNDLLMNREGQVSTVSITSLESTNAFACMQYLDCRTGEHHRQKLSFTKAVTEK